MALDALFCGPCKEEGHICEVGGRREDFPGGIVKCPFHEDGVDCPKTIQSRRVAAAAIANDRARQAKLEAKQSRAPKQTKPAAFPEEAAQQETEAMAATCKCGCGTELSDKAVERGWEYNFGHRPAKQASSEPAATKRAGKTSAKKKPDAIVVAPVVNNKKANGEERTVATLVFSQQQLTHMFSMLPFEDQVLCMQAYVDRVI